MNRINRYALTSTLLACLTLLTGCQIIGGGIAGAGYDPVWTVNAAKDFEAFVSPVVEERKVEHAALDAKNGDFHSDDIMRTFPNFLTEIDDDLTAVPGGALAVEYKHERFRLFNGEVLAVERKLPSAFYMHRPKVGAGKLGDIDVVMIAVNSRATTGLTFVGLYSTQGETLYENVLCNCETWNIRASQTQIEIIGHKTTRELRLR